MNLIGFNFGLMFTSSERIPFPDKLQEEKYPAEGAPPLRLAEVWRLQIFFFIVDELIIAEK